MNSFEYYSTEDVNMPDARACCCDGNLFEDYKAEYEQGFEFESTTCEDYKINGEPWHDDQGWNCAVYKYGDLCTADGERGSGWKNAEWGTLQSHKFGKYHAKDACCVCGGGHKEKHFAVLPVYVRRLKKWAEKGFEVKHLNRAKKQLKQLKAHVESNSEENWDPTVVAIIDQCWVTLDGKLNQLSTWNDFQECYAEFVTVLTTSDAESYSFLSN